MGRVFRAMFASPMLQRLAYHARRVRRHVDRRFFFSLAGGLVTVVLLASVAVTLVEKPLHPSTFARSFYWAITTVFGNGDPSYVTSPGGFVVGWLLVLFGVAIVGTMTGALVGFVIDCLLKEGQGMGASGYRDHVVVCGWNTTARDLLDELTTDEYRTKVVLLHDAERNPAGSAAYYVRGDITSVEDLKRAGIEDARTAIVCPQEATNEADMRSILTIMAIESVAPHVRTVVEVNNPAHVPHVQRAHANEILVTSRIASHLLARTALYPGLSELMTDIVSGGEGSELYRVAVPTEYVGLPIDDVAARLRGNHRATLLAVVRDGVTVTNPPREFALRLGDDAVVVAQGLHGLEPLEVRSTVAAPPVMTPAQRTISLLDGVASYGRSPEGAL
ncbi:MAG: voltage-gated potassium channel [Frankiaceae bacterium]|jgi:voltage-gated potassium channel|nr:voltage-gated potassium channel [Frankiaceae bacterium]